MSNAPANDEPETVGFTILGNAFSVRVRKSEKERFLEAVKHLQDRASAMLRTNPNLSPMQAAIMIALDTEVKMLDYISANTPFQDRAFSLIHKIQRELLKDSVQ